MLPLVDDLILWRMRRNVHCYIVYFVISPLHEHVSEDKAKLKMYCFDDSSLFVLFLFVPDKIKRIRRIESERGLSTALALRAENV